MTNERLEEIEKYSWMDPVRAELIAEVKRLLAELAAEKDISLNWKRAAVQML